MWRLRYYRIFVGVYRIELTTPAGFLYAYDHSSVIPDVELEAWLILDAGLEGPQVDVRRSCAVGHVFDIGLFRYSIRSNKNHVSKRKDKQNGTL